MEWLTRAAGADPGAPAVFALGPWMHCEENREHQWLHWGKQGAFQLISSGCGSSPVKGDVSAPSAEATPLNSASRSLAFPAASSVSFGDKVSACLFWLLSCPWSWLALGGEAGRVVTRMGAAGCESLAAGCITSVS